jgi:excisionase family DNA binding protein
MDLLSCERHDPRMTEDAITPWLNVNHAARRAQCSTATLRREIARGRLRCARIGGRKSIRIRPEWIDSWLEAGATPIEVRR